MDRSDSANLRLCQVDRRAEVKGLRLDLIRCWKTRAVEAVNRWGRGLGSLCDEPVYIGLVKNCGHIRFRVASVVGIAPLLNHEFGEINLLNDFCAEQAVKFGNQLLAQSLAPSGVV